MTRHQAQPTAAANPWGLTVRQVQVLEALLANGCDKLVARELGVSKKTVELTTAAARRKMGQTYRLHMLLVFDRWRRGAGRADAGSEAALRVLGDPCTCSTPSGPRHCPEHADNNPPRKATP